MYTSYYGDGSLVEPRNQVAPNVLLKHRGEFTHDGEEDNHVTTLHITEAGAVRVSVMNTETQERTTQEMDENGNYRVIYQGDELLLDEAQVWVEYGINKETKSFYIKNENQEFEFTDKGVLINGTPLIDNLEGSLQEAFEKLKSIQKDLEDINSLLEGAGKENLEELIRTAKDSIEASGKASSDVEKLRGDISTVSGRVEGNIKKLDDYMKTMQEFVDDVNGYMTTSDATFLSLGEDIRGIRTEQGNLRTDVDNLKDKVTDTYIKDLVKQEFLQGKSKLILNQDRTMAHETIKPTVILSTEDIRTSLGSSYNTIYDDVVNTLISLTTEEERLQYIDNNLRTLADTNLKKLVGNKELKVILTYKSNNKEYTLYTTNYDLLYNNKFIPIDLTETANRITTFKIQYELNGKAITELEYISPSWT